MTLVFRIDEEVGKECYELGKFLVYVQDMKDGWVQLGIQVNNNEGGVQEYFDRVRVGVGDTIDVTFGD